MAAHRILVVEDEPVIALDIKLRLSQLGYQVVAIADCAEAALDAVAQFQPHLVLMDIHLRGEINGIQTAARIREQFNLPVVFLTAHADPATLEEAKATQPFGYIVKPFETHDLSTAIEIALNCYTSKQAMQSTLDHTKELHHLKSQFVSIVAHEFRNPLSSILFCLDFLERYEGQIPADKRPVYFERMREAVMRMNELLEDVLLVGETETETFHCKPQPINLVQFCHTLVDECQTATQRIKLLIRNPVGLSVSYAFDERLLSHILGNLLSNALKYSPDHCEVTFEMIQELDQVSFRVQDQGIGISPTDVEQLFNWFHRGENVGNIPGTGLGLAIVKQCVDLHKGTITVESEIGVGSTFIVTLPRLEDSTGSSDSQSPTDTAIVK